MPTEKPAPAKPHVAEKSDLDVQVERLDAELLKMNNERDALNEKIRDLRRHRDRVAGEAAVRTNLAKMPAHERDALVQHLSTAGAIKPTSGVGTPGK
jgi:hypothetical protein